MLELKTGTVQTVLNFKKFNFLISKQAISINDSLCLYTASDLTIKGLYFHTFQATFSISSRIAFCPFLLFYEALAHPSNQPIFFLRRQKCHLCKCLYQTGQGCHSFDCIAEIVQPLLMKVEKCSL